MVLLIHTGGESGVPTPIPGSSRREATAHRLCSLTHHIHPKVRVSIAEPARGGLQTQRHTHLRAPRLQQTLCLALWGFQGPGTQAGHKHKRFLSPGNLYLQIKIRWCLNRVHSTHRRPSFPEVWPLSPRWAHQPYKKRALGWPSRANHWLSQEAKTSWSPMGKTRVEGGEREPFHSLEGNLDFSLCNFPFFPFLPPFFPSFFSFFLLVS